MKYANKTVKCKNARCNAEFSPGGWCSAYTISEGTTPTKYRHMADIPDNVCPMCRTPFKEAS